MFNFSKKPKKSPALSTNIKVEELGSSTAIAHNEPISTSKEAKSIVDLIHDEFDSAPERLLNEAKRIIDNTPIPNCSNEERMAVDLRRLGFINSSTVKRADTLEKARMEKEHIVALSKEDANLVLHYQQTYPFQKFLTIEELDRICDKYNLVYGPVSHYIRDVPEKNVEEIKNAPPLLSNDIAKDLQYIRIAKFYDRVPDDVKEIFTRNPNGIPYTSGYSEPAETLAYVALINAGYTGTYRGYLYRTAEIITVNRTGLFIAAPYSYFNKAGLTKTSKHGFSLLSVEHITDPVVFRYCRGGIQVLSKWGKEASDPILLNQIDN